MARTRRKDVAKVTTEVRATGQKKPSTEKIGAVEQEPIGIAEKAMPITKDADEYNKDEVVDAEEGMEAKQTHKRIREDAEEVAAKKSKTEGEFATVLFKNLPEGTNDNTFNSFLKKKGIQGKACRANYSRCKAFVDIDSSDKDKALSLSQVKWKGSELSVEETECKGKRGDAWKDNRDARTMFVKNVPYHATDDDLMGLFENVEEVRLLSDRDTGRSKGIAFVQFNDAAGLDKAMESKDEYELEGRQLLVDYTDSRSQRSARGGQGGSGNVSKESSERDSRTLYVKKLPYSATKVAVMALFQNVEEVRLPRDDEGRGRGIAFVQFRSTAALDKAMETKDKYELEGRKLRLDYMDSRGQRPGIGTERATNQGNVSKENSDRYSRTLYVKKLPYSATKVAVMALFDNVEEVRLPCDDEGRGRGIAFVQFCSTAALDKAMETKDKYELEGRKLSLEKAMDCCGQRPGKDVGEKKKGTGKSNGKARTKAMDDETLPLSEPQKRRSGADEIVALKKMKKNTMVTMLFSNLPDSANTDKLVGFLKTKDIECKECWANFDKRKALIDIEASDKGKALDLHGMKWNGTEIQVNETTSIQGFGGSRSRAGGPFKNRGRNRRSNLSGTGGRAHV